MTATRSFSFIVHLILGRGVGRELAPATADPRVGPTRSGNQIPVRIEYFCTVSGLISIPNPGLIGTATRPFTTLRGSVKSSRRSADSVTENSQEGGVRNGGNEMETGSHQNACPEIQRP